MKGTSLFVVEAFVKGHEFTRAVKEPQVPGLQPLTGLDNLQRLKPGSVARDDGTDESVPFLPGRRARFSRDSNGTDGSVPFRKKRGRPRPFKI